MMENITFPPRIIFDEREKAAILGVVEKTMTGPEAIDMYGKGPQVTSYEKEFAEYFGVKYAAAVSSGTAAIHSAVGALRLEPGSEIITTSITDPGTVAPILMQNCIPIFADVEYETLNLSARSIEKNITDRTRAIIAVHLAGQPCDMEPIMEIARNHNLYVIEDCAQAHGAKYKGRYVGTIGDLGVFSLMAGKHMNSGGQGGMVITNHEELYWNAKRFSDRGKPFNSEEKTNLLLGLNYRMTELQAAVGRVQLTKLADIKRKRQWVVEKLREGMSGLQAFQLWKFIDDGEVNPWFAFVRFNQDWMKINKEEAATILAELGLPVGAHYVVPIYNQYWIKNRVTYGNSQYPWTMPGAREIDYTNCCPSAERALEDHMTLYLHEGWGEKEINYTVEAYKKVEEEYSL
ncbi:MAG TPA: DegT/DnrJ/EryC1/StrS family aminotransferase [Candidatus Atribacteria bacterium]|nr:DegT/DnrJ/EryC1/StrS family aminotransferase [Candidatus Atribacteria bacterium]